MTRFNVSATDPATGSIRTIQANSASEALAAEDGYLDSGYTDIQITPL